MVKGLIDGIAEKFTEPTTGLIARLHTLLANAISGETFSEWVTAGKTLIEQIIVGILEGTDALYTALKTLLTRALARVVAGLQSGAWLLAAILGLGEDADASGAAAPPSGPADDDDSVGGMSTRNRLSKSFAAASVAGSVSITNIDNSIHIDMSPSYEQVQSPASLMDDLQLVLATVTVSR